MSIVKETEAVLGRNHKATKDVEWVGSKDGEYAISWEDFATKFKNVDYYKGYGFQEIATDLVVVGSDWWLERREYDGSEWWEYKELPVKSKKPKVFDKILKWDSPIKEIMEGEK